MKKIRLVFGQNYVAAGKKYEAKDLTTGVKKSYTVADSLAKKLLSSSDDRDIPYFALVTSEDEAQDAQDAQAAAEAEEAYAVSLDSGEDPDEGIPPSESDDTGADGDADEDGSSVEV